MAIQSAEQLFEAGLNRMLASERKIANMVQTLSQSCQNQQLRDALSQKVNGVQQQVHNLELCLQALGKQPRPVETRVVDCMVDAYRSDVQHVQSAPLKDLYTVGVVSMGQHMQVSAYRGLVYMSRFVGNDQVRSLLEKNLADEQSFLQRTEHIGQHLVQQCFAGPAAPGPQPHVGA